MGAMASQLTSLMIVYSKKTSKLFVTGLCTGNSLVTGEFPAQMASNAENVSIWWGHHDNTYIQRQTRTCGHHLWIKLRNLSIVSHPVLITVGIVKSRRWNNCRLIGMGTVMLCRMTLNIFRCVFSHYSDHGVSNHRCLDCLLNRLFGCRSKKTSKLRVTGFREGNSPVISKFPVQRASNAENVSIR